MRVAVHSGNFHADDIFSVALLRIIYPDIEVIRTRDSELLKTADIWADTGMEYDSDKKHFDHHMKEGAGQRDDIPYASFGLLWKHYGRELVSEEAWIRLENKFVKFIDAEDNGVNTYECTVLRPYTVPDLIRAFKPTWKDKNSDYDTIFMELVELFTTILKKEIEHAKAWSEGNEIVREKIKDSKDILVLDEYVSWRYVVTKESDIKFVVFKGLKNWCVQTVPSEEGNFQTRKDLPKAWGGLTDKLPEVTGVKTAVFCHHKLFLACADTKDDAIKLAELALKE